MSLINFLKMLIRIIYTVTLDKHIEFDFYWEIYKMVLMKNETEKAYPQQSTVDKDGEYSYLYTECGKFLVFCKY